MPTAAQDREVLNLKYPEVYWVLYGAQRPAACEELKIHTVHWGWHWGANESYEFMKGVYVNVQVL